MAWEAVFREAYLKAGDSHHRDADGGFPSTHDGLPAVLLAPRRFRQPDRKQNRIRGDLHDDEQPLLSGDGHPAPRRNREKRRHPAHARRGHESDAAERGNPGAYRGGGAGDFPDARRVGHLGGRASYRGGGGDSGHCRRRPGARRRTRRLFDSLGQLPRRGSVRRTPAFRAEVRENFALGAHHGAFRLGQNPGLP